MSLRKSCLHLTPATARSLLWLALSTQVYQVHLIQQSMFDMQDMKIKFYTTYSNNVVKIKPT